MDIDAIKAPRTHAAWKKAYDVKELAKLMVELSVQLEVELNVAIANEVFAENEAYMLEKELGQAQDRIRRLEEAGDMMVQHFYTDEPRSEMWEKAKEAKP
jgi:leucyl aminopeptidase (aminopeptidase T)